MRYWCAPSANSSSTSTRERGGAPRRRMVSRLPRAAGMPYIAQAMASRRVVFPAPLGPMMPVRPGPELQLGVLVLAEVAAGGGA